jgi:hypothetical protein
LAVLALLLVLPSSALAFCCPFPCEGCEISSSGQLNLVRFDRKGGTITLIPNVLVRGQSPTFALVVPTPTVPSLVSAQGRIWDEAFQLTRPISVGTDDGGGCVKAETTTSSNALEATGDVTIHGEATIGEFDTATLSSTNVAALVGWLRDHGFEATSRDSANFAPYAERGWVFTAMRIREELASDMPPNGWDLDVDPIALTFPGTSLEVPLSLLGARRDAAMRMTFFVIDEHRSMLPEFRTRYANRLSAREIEAIRSRYNALGGYLAPGLVLTRLERLLTEDSSVEGSVFIERASTDDELVESATRGRP